MCGDQGKGIVPVQDKDVFRDRTAKISQCDDIDIRAKLAGMIQIHLQPVIKWQVFDFLVDPVLKVYQVLGGKWINADNAVNVAI